MEQTLQQTTKPQTTQQPTQKLPSTFVFVSEIHSAKTTNGKDYKYIIDAETKERWNLFNNERVEVNHGYTFTYELNGTFKNIKSIIECTNIFKIAAEKELASKSDITKNIAVATSYAVDLISNGMATLEDLEKLSLRIYTFIQSKTDEIYNATQQKQ